MTRRSLQKVMSSQVYKSLSYRLEAINGRIHINEREPLHRGRLQTGLTRGAMESIYSNSGFGKLLLCFGATFVPRN